jgi:hypothetical protein
LTEAILEKFGGDGMDELMRNYRAYEDQIRARGFGSAAS